MLISIIVLFFKFLLETGTYQ